MKGILVVGVLSGLMSLGLAANGPDTLAVKPLPVCVPFVRHPLDSHRSQKWDRYHQMRYSMGFRDSEPCQSHRVIFQYDAH